jgi:cobyrinic acid a,c-diamide synthase
VLVVDASTQSRSAAAVVLGFERFDPELRVGAVIANRVGGDVHARWLRDAIASSCRAVPVGAIRHDASVTLPERHLGLVTAAEGPLTPELRRRLAETIKVSVDLDRLFEIAAPIRGVARSAGVGASASRARIGVAHDASFQFYYAENLDRLRAAGADLVFWSPQVPGAFPDVDGLYFGGGYPELHARALSANVAVRESVRAFAGAGKPIYAECGGLMYLAAALEDLDGVAHPMVGLLPTTVHMRPRRLTLGYAEVELTADAPIGGAGTIVRGHEFHYSSMDQVPASVARVYQITRVRGEERPEGYLINQALMSYVHLHFASSPLIAQRFVDSCAAVGRPRKR